MSDWLDRIEVASPCHESWAEMTGDARQRHCDSCDQTVYDLSGLTRLQAKALVLKQEEGERVCVRFRRRADGTVLTADCPTQVRESRSRWRQVRAVAAGLLALLGGAFGSGCTEGTAQSPGTARTPGAAGSAGGSGATGASGPMMGAPVQAGQGPQQGRSRALPMAGSKTTSGQGGPERSTPCCPDGQGECCIENVPTPRGGEEFFLGEAVAPGPRDGAAPAQPALGGEEGEEVMGDVCLPDEAAAAQPAQKR